MAAKRSPVVFDVYRNGRRLCRAGVGDGGVLTAIIDWVGSDQKERPPRKEQTRLHVGGLRHDENGSGIHPSWVDLKLRPGDEIRVMILRAPRFDKPHHEKVWTAEDTRRSQENYLEHVAPQYGWVKPSAKRRTRGRVVK